MSDDFFSLRDLRKSRSKNFLDADDVPVMSLEDSVVTAAGYVPWRNYGRGTTTPPEEVLDFCKPAHSGKSRKGPTSHAKQGHSSIDDFFAKRDRRKNRKEAGRIVPADVARRIFEINAKHSAGDADSTPTFESAAETRADADRTTLQVVKPPPDGWDAEADGEGDGDSESPTEGVSWHVLESNQGLRTQDEQRQDVDVDRGDTALLSRQRGAYLPPQLRRRLSERPANSDSRQLGGLRGAAGTSSRGQASALDISCLEAFPALGDSWGGGGRGGRGLR